MIKILYRNICPLARLRGRVVGSGPTVGVKCSVQDFDTQLGRLPSAYRYKYVREEILTRYLEASSESIERSFFSFAAQIDKLLLRSSAVEALESQALLPTKEETMKEVLLKTPKWKPKFEAMKLADGEVASEKENVDKSPTKALKALSFSGKFGIWQEWTMRRSLARQPLGRSNVGSARVTQPPSPSALGLQRERWRLAIAGKMSLTESESVADKDGGDVDARVEGDDVHVEI
ncbi:hypothetical protein Fmac_008025 [Flemingia macrophylla]|uniref:Uncharacterized protein n=1 Tax=Flemingia macrophylla TaxID=520843 RepID=A0ABD1MYM6_9FABA